MSLTDGEIQQDASTIEGLENLEQTWHIDYDDLEFGGELARGNFGAVSVANYLGTRVAVKKLFDLEPDMRIYLQRELNVLKQVRHPNIVQFLGLSKTSEGLFLITEYVSRGDLCHLLYDLNVHELDSWTLRLAICVEAAQALAFVHAKNLIHRDIKAANFLVDDNWHVKLCDFGFSRSMGATHASQQAGSVMTLCGTDEWMAPETMMGLEYDQKADVFSFGMYLTEMVTRSEPEPRDPGKAFRFNAPQFIAKVPAGTPPDIVKLITDQCTTYNADSRPTAKDVLRTLKAVKASYKEPSGGAAGASGHHHSSSGKHSSSKDKKEKEKKEKKKEHAPKEKKKEGKSKDKDKKKERGEKKEKKKERDRSSSHGEKKHDKKHEKHKDEKKERKKKK